MAHILPLGFTACQVVIQTLLDLREDTDHKLAYTLIKHLATDRYTAVSEQILIRLVEFYPNQVTNEVLEALAPPHIRKLQLRDCTNVSAIGLNQVFQKCYRLQGIDLSKCDQLLRASFFRMSGEKAPWLTGITVEGCASLTDHGVRTLLQCLPNLKHLSLRNSDNVTDEMFLLDERRQFSRETLTHTGGLSSSYQCSLVSVDVSQCGGLTSTAVRHLTTLCGPSLQAVNISWTEVDCIALWYLSGYSLSTAAQLAGEVDSLQCGTVYEDHGAQKTASPNQDPNVENKMTPSEINKQDSLLKSTSDMVGGVTPQPDSEGELLSPLSLLSALSPGRPNSESGEVDSTLNDSLHVAKELIVALKLHEYESTNFMSEASCQTDTCACCVDDLDALSLPEEPMIAWESPRDKTSNIDQLITDNEPKENDVTIPDTDVLEPNIEELVATTFTELKIHEGNKNLHCAKAFTNLAMDSANAFSSVHTGENVCVMLCENLCDETMEIEEDDLTGQSVEQLPHPLGDLSALNEVEPSGYNDSMLNGGSLKAKTDSTHLAASCSDNPEPEVLHCSLSNPTANLLLNYINTVISPDLNQNGVPREYNEVKDKINSVSDDEVVVPKTNDCDMVNELPVHGFHCDLESCDKMGASSVCNQEENLECEETNLTIEVDIEKIPSCSTVHKTEEKMVHTVKDYLYEPEDDGMKNRVDLSPGSIREDLLNRKLVQVFKPNLKSVCINGINFHTRELGEACLKAFFLTNLHMENFEMNWKEINDDILTFIGEYGKSLKNVSFTECDAVISIGLLNFFSKCKNLEKVNLQGVCFIGDAAITPLVENQLVTKLNMAECNISSQSLHLISSLLKHQLTELDLSWCEEVDVEGVESVARECTGLTALSIRQCPVQPQTLGIIAENLTSLTYLNLSGVNILDDNTLVVLAVRLKLLQKLDIGWNMDVTDVGLHAVMSHCIHMRELISPGIKQITSAPFTPIISDVCRWRKCQALLRLKYHEQKLLEGTEDHHYSSDEEFEDMYLPHRSTSYAPNLRKLDVEYCDKIQDHMMEEIVAVCRGTLTIKDYYGSEVNPSYVTCRKGKVFLAPYEPKL